MNAQPPDALEPSGVSGILATVQAIDLSRRVWDKARRLGFHVLQKATGYHYDAGLENDLRAFVQDRLTGPAAAPFEPPSRPLDTFDFSQTDRYLKRPNNPHVTFEASPDGPETDEFGRRGRWMPRGVRFYEDPQRDRFIKLFPARFTRRGEGRFLEDALRSGFFNDLCPLFEFLIRDEAGAVVGYAIRTGRLLTSYEFERYVGVMLRPLICRATEKCGYYCYDLIDHNVILRDGVVSLIDLESILPLEWFGQPPEFAAGRLDVIDIGWPLHTKWRSPEWYGAFLRQLRGIGSEGGTSD